MWPNRSSVDSLIYWSSPAHSAIVFGAVLVVLLSVKYVSFLSVMGNLALALITATMAFRIYKAVLAAVNKNSDGHPFRVNRRRIEICSVLNMLLPLFRPTWIPTPPFPATRCRR